MTNTLFTGDNLYILTGMNSACVDLIYLDPPFNSKRMYSAPIGSQAAGSSFKDMWTWKDIDECYLESMFSKYPELVQFIYAVGSIHGTAMKSYLTYMAQRIIELHRVLKSHGSVYVHCDPTASHHLKVLMDSLFGKDNFANEIIWRYGKGGRGAKAISKNFPRNHDVILKYTKTKKFYQQKIFTNTEFPIKQLPPYVRKDTDGRYFKTSPRGDYTDESVKKLRAQGRIYTTKNNKIRIKYFLETAVTDAGEMVVLEPVRVGDVWADIKDMMHAPASERTGYPTQKPLALLKRIIQASSQEGDVVLDPFCGCATTMVAAQQLGRNWIGIDISEKAAELVAQRLRDDAGLFTDFVHRKDVPQRTDMQVVAPIPSIKAKLHQAQHGLCNGCSTAFDMRNLEIDHIIPKSKGGGDYYQNFQLLCSNCNRIKGNRPMEYLNQKFNDTAKKLSLITFGE